jgi:hypothetical protein
MMTHNKLLQQISLKGLKIAPSQVRGAIRLVPILRPHIREDLRLFRRSYDEDITIVSLKGEMLEPGLKYISYIPQGLILSWTNDGSCVAATDTQIYSDGKQIPFGLGKVRVMQRMAKREAPNRLRFLPLHVAMEGFLGMFFSAPAIAWKEYSQKALSSGLNPRWEYFYIGKSIPGFEDALRVFEIHPQQVGVLVFIAEAFASAFIVPHPQDYRALHTSLLEDFYGELIYQYGLLYDTTYPCDTSVDESKINKLEDLRGAIVDMRSQWEDFQGFMASSLLADRTINSKPIYTAGEFVLQRFITDLNPKEVNHLGEAIASADGEIQYLKSYRLSSAQTRRVYLLSQLAANNWHLKTTASKLNLTPEELIIRFEDAGFGYLFSDSVRTAARL